MVANIFEKRGHKWGKYSGIIPTLLLVLVVNLIGAWVYFRADLTAEKRYSLHTTTKEMLKSLDKEIVIKIYLESDDMPIQFARLRTSLIELLNEFDEQTREDIFITYENPTLAANKEQRFAKYKYLQELGLKPFEVEQSDVDSKESVMLFPGVVISYNGMETGVSLLKKEATVVPGSEMNIQNSIQSLEYELTNALRKLSQNETRKVAFIEGHGELSEYDVSSIANSLSEYYEVQRGPLTGQLGNLQAFDALIVAKPTQRFSEIDKYILDQYVMYGGKVLFMLEGAQVEMDSLNRQAQTLAIPFSNNLEDMLFKYGVRINPDLVEDMQCTQIGVSTNGYDGQSVIRWYPWTYFPLLLTNNSHSINKYLDVIRTEFISTVDTVNPDLPVKKTVLLSTSAYSRINGTPLPIHFENLGKKIEASDFRAPSKPVAVLLEGRFTSVFANRPAPLVKEGYIPKFESDTGKVIVVSDGDMIKNIVSDKGEPYPLGFDRYAKRVFTGNTQFIVNAVNYLCDDMGLMTIRNREIKLRMLDKQRVKEDLLFWQIVNVGGTLLFISLFSFGMLYMRKRRYVKEMKNS